MNIVQQKRYRRLIQQIKHYKMLYLMLIPVIAFYIIFKYVPIYGLQLSFKKFSYAKGIAGSPWVGWDNFMYLFSEPEFWRAFRNTIQISMIKLLIAFPLPVILSILLNEVRKRGLQRSLQVVYTFPHFLSWIILSSICLNMFSSTGAINNLLNTLNFSKISVLTNPKAFRLLLAFSEAWKESGWSTIIYMATIVGIDPSLYEAALMDGANRWHKIRYIIWPGIRSVIVTMLILQVGRTMSAGFMQIFNLYHPTVYSVADILDTYVYRISFLSIPNFGVSTAAGFFIGITNFILLFIANWAAKFFGESGIM